MSSADGLDEFSVSGATRVVELRDGRLSTYDVTPEQVDLEPARDGAVGAGTPEQNALVLRDVLAGNAGTERSLAVLNAGAAIYVGGGADTLAEGVRAAERAIDSGAAAGRARALGGGDVVVMPRLDELVDATRDAVRRRQRERPLSDLAAEVETGREGRPFAEALSRPGTSRDRRAQAALAVGRHDPRRRELRRDRPRLRARRRGRDLDPHRGGALRRLARRPARGARRHRAADPPQGLHDRPVPALRGEGGRARTACCWWSARWSSPRSPSLYAQAQELDLDALVEIHDDEELERALELDCDVIGINNRNLEDFSVDIQRTFDLLADVPAGKVVVSESGIHHRGQIEELEQVGVDAVLVGEALMRGAGPGERGSRAQ